jgi:Sec-independent protein translocase protein TatA
MEVLEGYVEYTLILPNLSGEVTETMRKARRAMNEVETEVEDIVPK